MCACERQIPPPLVEVTDLAPRAVEAGDHLEVHGTGFPQGRVGRVTLTGAVYRPGESPQRNVSFDAEGTVATPDRLELVVRESLAEHFCGRGDHAAHATFVGEVAVSFASINPGAPPLVGRLRETTLDILPSSARASVADARAAEGAKVLAFLGIVPGALTGRGAPVEQVEPGSLAEHAQIQVGDVVAEADGVHVLGLGDILPASSRAIELSVRHADSGAEETKSLSLVAYSGDRVPIEYAPALVIVGLAIAVLILLVVPGPPALAAFELRTASSLRGIGWRSLVRGLFGTGSTAAVSTLVSALVAGLALMPWVVSPEADGVVLAAVAGALFVWARVAGAKGFGASTKTFFQTLSGVLVLAATVVLVIVQVGAIELAEIVRTQGVLPWQLVATRHPSLAVAGCVYGAVVIALLRVRDPVATKHGVLLERAALLFAAALFVALFLGGWQLAAGRLACATLFLVKTWLVTGIFLGVAHVLPSTTPAAIPRLVLRRLLPGVLLAAGLVAASRFLVPGLAIETAFGATIVAVVFLFVVRLAARVRIATAAPEPHASSSL